MCSSFKKANPLKFLLLSLFLIVSNCCFSQKENIPLGAQKLITSYPGIVVKYENNKIIFFDGTTMIYDDGKRKTPEELLNNPDIEDMFFYTYISISDKSNDCTDAGRIRNEDFFKKIYGSNESSVKEKLTIINWCPNTIGQKIKVTTVNGIDGELKKISYELDRVPEFKKYLKNIGGTFLWRKISGSNRISMHSFGMTLDINTEYSDYWQWACKCKDENSPIPVYKNKIPIEIVSIFEKHGFIWGGKWKHFDTMHFEYRPELIQ